MAISTGSRVLTARLETLIRFQRFCHSLAGEGLRAQINRDIGRRFQFSHSDVAPSLPGHAVTSKWRKVQSRCLGITRSMIPPPVWTVLTILRSTGFETYLVGGCVRDLILCKIPKDFDVITTASLERIKSKFHRCRIVGQRFPICMVYISGSIIEVSSFDPSQVEERETIDTSEIPDYCVKEDFMRWRNCMQRDFTINSLFFDPFLNKIYDYSNAMGDLKSLKLRTLIPAQLSFEEDCARIFRGLRIAARLGLSFAKDTATAIWKLSPSVLHLTKARIMMEVNYMLSYGAAEPSLFLLQRFGLLKLLFPCHAAYLAQHFNNGSAKNSIMLMELFSCLDKLITCDSPSHSSLWVGLLAFHLALLNNPQEDIVVWALSSVLYHGSWKEGLGFSREQYQACTCYAPEMLKARASKPVEELTKEVAQLASLMQTSVDVLTEPESLSESMSKFPFAPCPGLVFVPKKMGNDVAEFFHVLANDIESYDEGRENLDINYYLLGKGDPSETRHVLGRIMMDAMSNRAIKMRFKTQDVAGLQLSEKNEQEYAMEKNDEWTTQKEHVRKMNPLSVTQGMWLSSDAKNDCWCPPAGQVDVVKSNCHVDQLNLHQVEEPLSSIVKQKWALNQQLMRLCTDREPDKAVKGLSVVGHRRHWVDVRKQEMANHVGEITGIKGFVKQSRVLDEASLGKKHDCVKGAEDAMWWEQMHDKRKKKVTSEKKHHPQKPEQALGRQNEERWKDPVLDTVKKPLRLSSLFRDAIL